MQARHSFPIRRQCASNKVIANPNAHHSASSSYGTEVRKAFVTVTPEIEETEAYVEVFGRQIKEDDVQHKANTTGAWTTRKLADPNTFFVAYPSKDIVHQLMTGGRAKGNGFSL